MSKIDWNLHIFWLLFLILYLVAIGMMIASLSTQKWVEIDPNHDDDFIYTHPNPLLPPQQIDGTTFKFKGSLTTLIDGLGSLNTYLNPYPTATINLEDKEYSRVGCGLCFIIDVSDEDEFPPKLWDFYNSWCSLMKRLWFAAGFYITLEVISLVNCLAVIIIILLFINGKPHTRLAFLFSNSVWVCHYLAILVWIGLTKARFNEDCENLYYSDHSSPEVCAEAGPRIGISTLIFLPFLTIPFLIYVYLKHRSSNSTPVQYNMNNSGREINADKAENKDN